MRKQLLSLLITTIFLSTAILAQGANSAGHWEGSIDTPNGPLAISIDLAPGKDGKWAGEIGVPSQGLSGYPLSNVKVEGASVSFEMRGSPGVPAFNGKLSEDGKTISGEMKQGGTTMPFKIERKGEAKLTSSDAPATARAGPAPKIEGSWEGALDVGGTTLRLVVKIAKAADGGLTATLDSPDQGRSDMPVTSIAATETDVRFDLKYFGAYFEGKLNKELSEMTGNWYQGGASIPLVLKKAK